MKHRYLPMTAQDRVEMMETVGIQSIDELFSDIPEAVRYQGTMPMSEPLDEYALLRHMKGLADRNADFDSHASFLGAGLYDHHIPVVINHVISVQNSTLLTPLINRRSAKANCKRSSNSNPTFAN